MYSLHLNPDQRFDTLLPFGYSLRFKVFNIPSVFATPLGIYYKQLDINSSKRPSPTQPTQKRNKTSFTLN